MRKSLTNFLKSLSLGFPKVRERNSLIIRTGQIEAKQSEQKNALQAMSFFLSPLIDALVSVIIITINNEFISQFPPTPFFFFRRIMMIKREKKSGKQGGCILRL